jgi:hypothetical protein
MFNGGVDIPELALMFIGSLLLGAGELIIFLPESINRGLIL